MANEKMALSLSGLADLRRREGAVMRYYNDAAGNCTFGVGALEHHGHCSADELRKAVSADEVNKQLASRVHTAEHAVRRKVQRRQLTQQQFDALVSFTFNAGATRASRVLEAAESGNDAEVARLMALYVYIHPVPQPGKPRRPLRLQGLVLRRREEVTPFVAKDVPAKGAAK